MSRLTDLITVGHRPGQWPLVFGQEADARFRPKTRRIRVGAEEITLMTRKRRRKVTASRHPKTMSGMSILGNEEAPKSLVIIPWKIVPGWATRLSTFGHAR